LESLNHLDQIGQRVCLHLLHRPAAVNLYCIFGSSNLSRDLLVKLVGDNFRILRRVAGDAVRVAVPHSGHDVVHEFPAESRGVDRVTEAHNPPFSITLRPRSEPLLPSFPVPNSRLLRASSQARQWKTRVLGVISQRVHRCVPFKSLLLYNSIGVE